MKKKRMKQGKADMVFMGITYLILVFVLIATLYPMIFVLSASFSDPKMVSSGKMILFPTGFNLEAYRYLLKYTDIWVGYGNTLFYTVCGTVVDLLVTIPAAYALSRKDLNGRGFLMSIIVITMYFSGGLIPSYLNVKSFGLLNTRTVMVVLGAVSAYNLIVARTFFASTIPWELHEAAYLDGANDFSVFTKVVLPLSKPIMVVMMLYYGVGHWNSYFNAMIYLKDTEKFSLQLILRQILLQAQSISNTLMESVDAETMKALLAQQDTANQLKYAVIVIATVPMLILYPFLEKNFAKGVMIGSVKG